MKIREIPCKSCMTRSRLTDYVINPYTGCQHGCKYCYATFMRRFHGIREGWGDFVFPKAGCHELLAREMERNRPGNVWLSSVTDPYQPVEGKYMLTRRVLEAMDGSPFKSKFTIEVLTKSALVRRDFGLLRKLNAELGMSMNTLDGNKAKLIEPFASPPSERMRTLKEAKAEGIRVYGFISPVIPGITELEPLFRELRFCEYVWVELLNTKPSALAGLVPVLREHFPDAAMALEKAIRDPRWHYESIRKEVKALEERHGLRVRDIVAHQI